MNDILVACIPVRGDSNDLTPRTDHLFSLDDLDLPGRGDRYIPDLYDLAHVAEWEPYNLHDVGHVS